MLWAAPTVSQYAAITALRDCDRDVEEMRKQYDMRRQYCVRKLNEMGLKTFEPKGAFYVFPEISSLGMTSDEFCEKLLNEQHVAIIPGTAFGESGQGFARISYAYSIEHLQEAMRRIAQFIKIDKERNKMDNLKLIDLLVQNPRASITDLADILGETEETVDRAKKRFRRTENYLWLPHNGKLG